MNPPPFTLHLPAWLQTLMSHTNRLFPTMEERMNFVIELSRLNVQHQTGGPFAAAIFRSDNGSLLAPGVNMVLSGRCSVLHAEIVAIMAAQHWAAFDLLGDPRVRAFERDRRTRGRREGRARRLLSDLRLEGEHQFGPQEGHGVALGVVVAHPH